MRSKGKSAGAGSKNGVAFHGEMTEFLAYPFHVAALMEDLMMGSAAILVPWEKIQ